MVMKKNLGLYLLLLIVTLMSCDDDFGVKESELSDKIGFNLSMNNISSIETGRSCDSLQRSSVNITLLNEKLRGDSLFLFTIVEDSLPSCIKSDKTKGDKTQSRGIEINEGNISDMGVSGIVYTGDEYTDWGTTGSNAKMYMYNEQTTKAASWSTNRFWPETEDKRMRFYSYSPYKENFLPKTVGTPSFDYTISDDITEQTDLLVASSDVACPNDYKPADISFTHALTAVKFEVANTVEKITVKAIRVKGVYYKGTYTYQYSGYNKDDGDYTTPYYGDLGTWDVDETEEKKTYEIASLNKQIVGGTDKNIPLNEGEYVMMLMPQTLPAGATIEVDVKDDVTGWEGTLTASIAGNVWEKGKCVKYVVSTKDIVVEYYFDILNSEENEFPYYGGNGTLYVESYKTTYHVGGALKENVSWTINSSTGNIELNKTSGGESNYVEAINYDLGPAPIDNSSTNKYLKDVTALGSYNKPYDLSTKGGSELRNTANCYMVGAPGYYQIPLVIGNAILNGSRNNNSSGDPLFSGNQFINYKGQSWLTQPEVYKDRDGANIEIGEPYLVWQDAPGLVSNLRIVDGTDFKYLAFEVNKYYICDGNAVIAVKDTNDNIMWSWHIWVSHYMVRWSDSDPKERTIKNKLYGQINSDGTLNGSGNTFDDQFMHKAPDKKTQTDAYKQYVKELEKAHGSHTFTLLSKFIGLCEAENKKYGGTNATIEFVQTDGNSKKSTIEINYADKEIKTAYNACYYQWGRKDPMRPWGEWNGENYNNHKTCFGNDGKPLADDYFYSNDPALNIATTIKNPAIYYGASSSATTWCTTWPTNYENLWQAKPYSIPRGEYIIKELVPDETIIIAKTIYDPCPPGYEMPRSDAFTGFLLDNKSIDKQVTGRPEDYEGYYVIENGQYKFTMGMRTGEGIGEANCNNNGNILREPNPCAFVSGYQEYAYWFRSDVNGAGRWDGYYSEEDVKSQIPYSECLLLYALGAKGGGTSNGDVKEFRHMGNALTATLVDIKNDGNSALPSRLYFMHDHNGWMSADNKDCRGHNKTVTDQTGWSTNTIEAFYNYDGELDKKWGVPETSNQIKTVSVSNFNLGFTVIAAKTGANGIKVE